MCNLCENKVVISYKNSKVDCVDFLNGCVLHPHDSQEKKKSYKLWNVIEECYMDRINGILNSWIQYWNVIVLSYFINLNWARNNSYWRDWFNKHEHSLWWKLGTCNTKHKANDTEKNALMNTENCEHIFKIQKDLDWIHTVELWVQILQINS